MRQNFPLIVLFLVFLGLLNFIWQVQPYKAPLSHEPEPTALGQEKSKPFKGRMDMPSLDDIYVLDNSAGRDVEALEKSIQGRAAGLHWLGQEHFKKKGADDIRLGLHLVVDSLGIFTCKEILFSYSFTKTNPPFSGIVTATGFLPIFSVFALPLSATSSV